MRIIAGLFHKSVKIFHFIFTGNDMQYFERKRAGHEIRVTHDSLILWMTIELLLPVFW